MSDVFDRSELAHEPQLAALHAALHALAASSGNGIALAYSGGLDSRFLAYTLKQADIPTLLLHVSGPHVPPRDTADAKAWAAKHQLSLQEIPLNPLILPDVARNARQRCYACKYLLFSRLKDVVGRMPLCDGSHTSDRQGHRPGLQALEELGIQSPLVDADLDKNAIRRLARLTGLDDPDQRARPCLLTRLPYDFSPTPELLSTIAKAEEVALDFFWQASAQTLAPKQKVAHAEPAPDFRVRLVAPDRLELHITSSNYDLGALQAALRPCAQHSMLPISVVVVDVLSGFFDRLQQ